VGGIICEKNLLEQYSKYTGTNKEMGKYIPGFQGKNSEV
jgi:hypothetical protein